MTVRDIKTMPALWRMTDEPLALGTNDVGVSIERPADLDLLFAENEFYTRVAGKSNRVSTTFDEVVTFGRTSPAWKRNALGHWVEVGAGEPRTGHHILQDGQLVPAGLAVCSTVRTNNVTLSLRFDTGWNATDVTVTPDTHISPDGTMNADTLTRSGEQGYLIKSSAATDGQTKSIYARTVSGTGTVGLLGHNSVAASEMALTEEWQLFDLPVDTSETGGSNFYAVDFRIGNLSEIVVWGAQLDDVSYVTDHIPTDVSVVSTDAETVEINPVALAKALGQFGPELTLAGAGAASWDATTRTATFAAGSYSGIHTELADGDVVLVSGNVTAAGNVQIKQNDGDVYPLIYEGTTGYFEGLVVVSNSVGLRIYLADGGLFPDATINNLQIRKVTMPAAFTVLLQGTVSYENGGLNPQVRMLLWQADGSNRVRLQLNTVDARTGQFIAFTQKDGVANSALSAADAYSPGAEVPMAVAAVFSASTVEGFSEGVSTGYSSHAGLADLLTTPLELFTDGSGTIERLSIWAHAIGSTNAINKTT